MRHGAGGGDAFEDHLDGKARTNKWTIGARQQQNLIASLSPPPALAKDVRRKDGRRQSVVGWEERIHREGQRIVTA